MTGYKRAEHRSLTLCGIACLPVQPELVTMLGPARVHQRYIDKAGVHVRLLAAAVLRFAQNAGDGSEQHNACCTC